MNGNPQGKRAALAADEVREPVAHAHVWMDTSSFNDNEEVRRVNVVFTDPEWRHKQPINATVPLYTHPPAPAAQAEQPTPTDPLYDDAYLRGVALGLPEGDSRRWHLCRIADRIEHREQPTQGLADEQKMQALRAQIDKHMADWSRFHHLMAKHGLHPGRTDDDLLTILEAALASAPRVPTLDDALAAERERWQRIATNAQAVTTGCADRLDYFEVPSHLMAALALALDEGPNNQAERPTRAATKGDHDH